MVDQFSSNTPPPSDPGRVVESRRKSPGEGGLMFERTWLLMMAEDEKL